MEASASPFWCGARIVVKKSFEEFVEDEGEDEDGHEHEADRRQPITDYRLPTRPPT